MHAYAYKHQYNGHLTILLINLDYLVLCLIGAKCLFGQIPSHYLLWYIQSLDLSGTVVERRSLTGKLSLSHARPLADG